MGDSTIITIIITVVTTAVVIFIGVIIIIIIIIIIITIGGAVIEISVFIVLGVFFVVEGKFIKLFKLFVEIIISRLIILISDGVAENISDFYFEVVSLYILIEFIFIEEGSEFIFEIELFYIFGYFKILYFMANFYSKINTVIFGI